MHRRVLAVEPELMKVGLDALELIIVNDCSKDRTAEIVKGYLDRGVVLFAMHLLGGIAFYLSSLNPQWRSWL